ncbi:hypothetical protein SRHO_G00003750 [Serrasalmus rhombeus]
MAIRNSVPKCKIRANRQKTERSEHANFMCVGKEAQEKMLREASANMGYQSYILLSINKPNTTVHQFRVPTLNLPNPPLCPAQE